MHPDAVRSPRSFTLLTATAILAMASVAWLIPAGDALARGEDPPIESMSDLFTYDGLLDQILTRPFAAANPVLGLLPPLDPPLPLLGPDPDGIPHATVTRYTIDGPLFNGFYRSGLDRAPAFCETPQASPTQKQSRITLEIWVPDPIDLSDPKSAVVLVIKSASPDLDDLRPPRLLADQLAKWGICSVVWWERDDNPVDTTPYPDIAVVSRSGSSWGYLLGDGTAAFEPPLLKPYPEDAFPKAIETGDFNGDGNVDVVVALDGADVIDVRFGDGYGAFKDNTGFATGAFPRALAVASLDPLNDAHEDIVVANRNSDDVTILLGDGDGGFEASQVGVGVQPSDVVVADFDEDGNPDIAVSNGGDSSVTILFGDGAGGFGGPLTFSVGDNPFAMAVGDFDGDFHLDLITANRDSDDCSLLLGNGNGTFQAAMTHPAGTDPSDIVVGHFDVGPTLDVAVANGGSNDVTVLLGNGFGGFGAPSTFMAGDFPNGLAAGDVDGNTTEDLVVANRDSGDVTVLLGNGFGGFVEAPDSPFVVDDGPSDVVLANLTNSTQKLAHQLGYFGDGALQIAGFGWMVHRRLIKAPSEALTNQELRFDFRFAYAQAYLMATTFFQEYMKQSYPGNPDIDDWLDALKISYAGGSKRGGGISTAVFESNILSTVDPRNVVGLFISGYEGLDAGELSGFHRYESDWGHTFDLDEMEEFRADPCPTVTCDPEPCPSTECGEDSGEHPFKSFAIWAHRMRHETQSYAIAYTPASSDANMSMLSDVLIVNAVGTHDWINPLGSHRAFYNEFTDLDSITLQRINHNHGSLIERGQWTATEILHMRALYNMRWAADQARIDDLPLHRIRWVDLQEGTENWTATIEHETTSQSTFAEDYTVWVAVSDDRDFRRNSTPVQRRPLTPCIDSDPNPAGDLEDVFFAATTISIDTQGNQRVITFEPPPAVNSFVNPLVSVIVEGRFDGSDPEDTIDDLIVTTIPEFLNEDVHPGSISACQGKDGEHVITVNGQTGTADEYWVLVDSVGSLSLDIALPSGGGNGKFLANLDRGFPTPASITRLSNQLGDTCFPFLLNRGAAPVARFNSIGKEHKVGGSEYFGAKTADPDRAPTNLLDLPNGDSTNMLIGHVFTLQGVILNPAVAGPKQASITNAVVITII